MGCARIAFAMLLVLAATATQAQENYPNRPIKLIVGFTAGGPTDTPARLVAEKLRGALGQSIIVENRPGAGGKIALDYMLSQPRDGYALSLCTYIDATNTVLLKNPGYTLADLAPISQITRAYYAFTVPTTLPVQDLASFAAHAKARPGALNYGHVGAGSMPELVAKRFEQAAGIKMIGVPYKGTAEASMDLASGRLDFMVAPLIVVQPLLDAGSVKYIGMTSPERLAAFPQVPTASEQGFRITDNGWLGVCAGAGVPAAIIAQLNREVRSAVASPSYREVVEKTGVTPYAGSVEEFAQVVAETEADMRKLAGELGLEAK
ncbi:tripartite-type tricarboxylate transporter receptor subunit TctC [Beijerinckia sp. GAS462]|nr:tripartite-type tricarboxylate transporter receptor subunit TctC [Beijerinckia sp. GAS462]SED36516.1 Tripartite-type tricarboxylate transporter, receptor component TctC [Beijerinckia sp. 28-YEA-48]